MILNIISFICFNWIIYFQTDGPLTSTQIANTLQLPNEMLGPSTTPAVRPAQNQLRPNQPNAGQARMLQAVGAQANLGQVPPMLQQQGMPDQLNAPLQTVQPTTRKDWHAQVNQDLRNHLVHKL